MDNPLQLNQSSFWNQLSTDDQNEYIRIHKEFEQNQKTSSKDRRVVTFRRELLTVLEYIERSQDNLENRCILTGVCFAGSIVCVNTRQLKIFLCRCKSSINGSFQQLGYLALKTKSKSRNCVVAALPSLEHQNAVLRQWTVRVISPQAQFCFVSSFSKIVIPETIDEDDLFDEKKVTPNSPMNQSIGHYQCHNPYFQPPMPYQPPLVNSQSQPNFQSLQMYPQMQQPHQQYMNYYQQQPISNQYYQRMPYQPNPMKTQTAPQKVSFLSQMKKEKKAVTFGPFVPPTTPISSLPFRPPSSNMPIQVDSPPDVSTVPTPIDFDLQSFNDESETDQNESNTEKDQLNQPYMPTSFSLDRFKWTTSSNLDSINFDNETADNLETGNTDIDIDTSIFGDLVKPINFSMSRSHSATISTAKDEWDGFFDQF